MTRPGVRPSPKERSGCWRFVKAAAVLGVLFVILFLVAMGAAHVLDFVLNLALGFLAYVPTAVVGLAKLWRLVLLGVLLYFGVAGLLHVLIRWIMARRALDPPSPTLALRASGLIVAFSGVSIATAAAVHQAGWLASAPDGALVHVSWYDDTKYVLQSGCDRLRRDLATTSTDAHEVQASLLPNGESYRNPMRSWRNPELLQTIVLPGPDGAVADILLIPRRQDELERFGFCSTLDGKIRPAVGLPKWLSAFHTYAATGVEPTDAALGLE